MNIEVVGRHALMFDDDSMAAFVNSGDALVEWNSLQIDRYDVRHFLSSPLPPCRRRSHQPMGDSSLNSELDHERYLDLPSKKPEIEDEEAEKLGMDIPVLEVGFFEKEYMDIELLGKGGCARVYSCKNRVDGEKIAVKAIHFKESEKEDYLIEAKILASLDHPNTVTYRHCWMEKERYYLSSPAETSDSSGKGTSDSSGKGTSDSSGKGTSDSSGKGTSDISGNCTSDSSGKGTSDSSGKGSSGKGSSGKGTSDSSGKGTSDSSGKGTGKGTSDRSEKSNIESSGKLSSPSRKGWQGFKEDEEEFEDNEEFEDDEEFYTLFIAMDFYNHRLTDLIRLDIGSERIKNIFSGLIAALEYIHSLKIVHGDIKTDNILLDDNETVKLSDFGMAFYEDDESSGTDDDYEVFGVDDEDDNAGFQLGGAYEKSSAAKDIYDFAICMMELMCPFKSNDDKFEALKHIQNKGSSTRKKLEAGDSFALLVLQILIVKKDVRPQADYIASIVQNCFQLQA